MTLDELEKMLRGRKDVIIGIGPGAAKIEDAEQLLGIRFPTSLSEYLQRFGHIEIGHFELYGLGEDLPKYLQLVAMTVTERTESSCPLPHDFVPLLNDGGGNLYCIDARPGKAGCMVFWDHAQGVDQEPEQCAPSLFDWISGLLGALDQGRG